MFNTNLEEGESCITEPVKIMLLETNATKTLVETFAVVTTTGGQLAAGLARERPCFSTTNAGLMSEMIFIYPSMPPLQEGGMHERLYKYRL